MIMQDITREALLDANANLQDFNVSQIRLGSSISEIDLNVVQDIYVEGHDDEENTKKIVFLQNSFGWVHYRNGVSFMFKKGRVQRIKIASQDLINLGIHKSEVIDNHGLPDKTLVEKADFLVLPNAILSRILVYRTKQLYFFINPQTEKVREIHFGEFDEKSYE
jgi:hypothetical protein